MRPDRFAPWVILLAVAVVADFYCSRWIVPVAAVVKARYGFFDNSTPLEPDREAVDVGSPLAVDRNGIQYDTITTGIRTELIATDRGGVRLASWDIGRSPEPLILLHPTRDTVYVSTGDRLYELEPQAAVVRWTTITNDRPEEVDDQFGYLRTWHIQSLVLNSRGELCAGGKLVRCFDSAGAVLWTSKEDDRSGVDKLIAGLDSVIYATRFSDVTAHDGSGAETWRVKNVRAVLFDPQRQVLYGTWNGWVIVLAPDGKELWRAKAGPAGKYFNGPFGIAVGADGMVFATTGELVALSATGEERWRFKPRDYLTSPPVIDANGDVLVSGRRRLYAVRPDGTVRWRATTLDELVRVDMRIFAIQPDGVYARGYPHMFIPRDAPVSR